MTSVLATEATRQNFQNGVQSLPEDKTIKPFVWLFVKNKKVDIRRNQRTPPMDSDLISFSDRQKVSHGTVHVMLKKHVEEEQLPPGAVNVEKTLTGVTFSFTGNVDEGEVNSIRFGKFNIAKGNIVSISDENGTIIW